MLWSPMKSPFRFAAIARGLGLEWSSDWVAFFLAGTVGLSVHGRESTTLGLGVSSSLF